MDVTDMPDQPSRRSDAAKSGYSGIEETKSEVGRQEQERLEELELNVWYKKWSAVGICTLLALDITAPALQ